MTTIERIRNEVLDAIKALLSAHGLTEVYASDVDQGSSPIIREDPHVGNNSFTLDTLSVTGGVLTLSISSCWSEETLDESQVDVETLAGILDWLRDNEENLSDSEEDEGDAPGEAAKNDNEVKKFTLRVIYGEDASRCASNEGFDKTAEKIGSGKIDGSCAEYTFDTEHDLELVIDIVEAADGWLGTFWNRPNG